MSVKRLGVLLVLLGCATSSYHVSGKPVVSDQARAYAHYLSGVVYEKGGELEAAAAEYAQSAKYDPDSLTLLVRLMQANLRLENLFQRVFSFVADLKKSS